MQVSCICHIKGLFLPSRGGVWIAQESCPAGLLLFAAAGCAGNEAAVTPQEGAVSVVTTIYPLAEIIRQLGGDRVSVAYLLRDTLVPDGLLTPKCL